ncbi:hypothetical protein BC827DRAFT_1208770, partial [Russula dissimulans]
VYKNVYLDIGEVFSMVSGGGQELLAWQALELTPTNYVMRSNRRWTSAARDIPCYLGSIPVHRALSSVLQDAVDANLLIGEEAVQVAEDILFYSANRVYHLGLEPQRCIQKWSL